MQKLCNSSPLIVRISHRTVFSFSHFTVLCGDLLYSTYKVCIMYICPKKSLLGHYAQIRRPHCFFLNAQPGLFGILMAKNKKYPHLSLHLKRAKFYSLKIGHSSLFPFSCFFKKNLSDLDW